MNILKNTDCLEYMKTMPNNSVDLIFADPPYNLSSEVYIDKLTGKPDLKKANDFMESSAEWRVDIRHPNGGYEVKAKPTKNSHPTVKPIKLLSHILRLFKTPNKQTILDPFMGSGSMGISAVETGYDYIGTEINTEYFKIAKARIEKEYYSKNIEIINLSDYRPKQESQLKLFK